MIDDQSICAWKAEAQDTAFIRIGDQQTPAARIGCVAHFALPVHPVFRHSIEILLRIEEKCLSSPDQEKGACGRSNSMVLRVAGREIGGATRSYRGAIFCTVSIKSLNPEDFRFVLKGEHVAFWTSRKLVLAPILTVDADSLAGTDEDSIPFIGASGSVAILEVSVEVTKGNSQKVYKKTTLVKRNGIVKDDSKQTHDKLSAYLESCNQFASFLTSTGDLHLSTFEVLPAYLRFDPVHRQEIDANANEILDAIHESEKGRKNWLIWAPSGTGKTAFVRALAKKSGAQLLELDLSKCSPHSTDAFLDELNNVVRPTIAFLDEVDSPTGAEWKYSQLFQALNLNQQKGGLVFLCVGSDPKGADAMEQKIRVVKQRGEDFCNRIPLRSTIPAGREEDVCLLFCQMLLTHLERIGRKIQEIRAELAVFAYLNSTRELANAHHLDACAKETAVRLGGRNYVLLTDLFPYGDLSARVVLQAFQRTRQELLAQYVRIVGIRAP